MKTITVKEEPVVKTRKIAKRDKVLIFLRKNKGKRYSSIQITNETKVDYRIITPILSHLRRERLVKSERCNCCEVGVVYYV